MTKYRVRGGNDTWWVEVQDDWGRWSRLDGSEYTSREQAELSAIGEAQADGGEVVR